VSTLLSKSQKSLACPRFKSSMRKLFSVRLRRGLFLFKNGFGRQKNPQKCL
jgi:hypothetical protein